MHHAPPSRVRRLTKTLVVSLLASVLFVASPSSTPEASAAPQPASSSAPCSTVVSSSSALVSAVGSAANGSVVCVADGSYGSVTIGASRSGFVTVRSQNPLGAVFDSVTFDDASFIRFEKVEVRGRFGNGQDNSHHIQLAGSVVGGVFVQSPAKRFAGPGPSDWVIEYNDIPDCAGFCVALVSESPDRYWPVSDMTVRGNKLGPMAGGQDAIRIHNWRNIEIVDNEIFGVIETGAHNDCLQSVWGGQGLVFAGNYLHDNNCQTFFLKDGYTQDILFEDNLSVRNRAGSAPVVGQIWPSRNVVIRNNTIWDDSGFYLRNGTYDSMFTSGPAAGYEVVNNVMQEFMPYDNGETDANRAGIFRNSSVLYADYNLFGGGWSWVPQHMGPHSIRDTSPDFVRFTTSYAADMASGDFRLRSSVSKGGATYKPGITWKLSDRKFGIVAFGLPPREVTWPTSSHPSGFRDIAGHTFEADITWMVTEGLTKGCNPPHYDRFCPDRTVTRGELAALVDRAMKLPATSTDFFGDDDDSIFEPSINRLAASGITTGCADDRFCPDRTVNRGQLAAFFARALDLPATSKDYFRDDGDSVFEDAINRFRAAGLTSGCTSTDYCPSRSLTRGQLAAFLHRVFG